MSARNSQRLAEIAEINKALWQFYITEGYMPVVSSYGGGGQGGWDEPYSSSAPDNLNANFLKPLIDKGYLASMPVDPLNNGHNDSSGSNHGHTYSYHCYTANNTYSLRYHLEGAGESVKFYVKREDTTCRNYTP